MKKFLKIALFTIILFLVGIIKVDAAQNITITDVELEEKSEYVIINEEASLDNNKITSNINFYDEGDYVIYKLTIKNDDDQDYKIEDVLDDNTSEYLSFEYTYEGNELKAKSEKEVLLKITYVSLLPYDAELTPEHTFNATTEVNISFKLTDYVSNPSTLDRIGKQSFTVILCILLLIAFVKLRKSKFLYVLVLGLFLIPIGTNAEREITFNIQLNNTIEASVNFLSSYWKNRISGSYSKIEFVKRATFPSDAVDVSQDYDGTIKAWIEDGTLYFGSRYKIFFPENSKELFFNLHVTEINFNDRVDTTFVTNMDSMLSRNNYIEIDVSSFRTGNVTDMYYMFYLNPYLKKLDLSSFDMTKVYQMNNLISECGSLEELIIDNWDLSNLSYGASYFIFYNGKLKTVSAKNLIFPANSSYFFYGNSSNCSLESIDLTGSDTSYATNLQSLFYGQYKLKVIKGIEDWDTSNVTSLDSMFYYTGRDIYGESISLDLSNWDVSNVTSFSYLFYGFASHAKNVSITIDGWYNDKAKYGYSMFREIGTYAETIDLEIKDTVLSGITNAESMFRTIGERAGTINLDIDGLDLSSLTSTNQTFSSIGYYASNVYISISNIDLSSTTDVFYLFQNTASTSNEVVMTLSNWKFNDLVKASEVFYYTGCNAKKVVLDISNWEMPNTTDMTYMFYALGTNAKDVTVKIKDFDTSALENASCMFRNMANRPDKASFEGLEDIDFSKTTNMSELFYSSYYYGTAVLDLGTIDIYADNLNYAFNNTANASLVINLHNNPTSYSSMFYGAATCESCQIVVNYTEDVTDIDNIIATKSSNSHVIKGNLIEE